MKALSSVAVRFRNAGLVVMGLCAGPALAAGTGLAPLPALQPKLSCEQLAAADVSDAVGAATRILSAQPSEAAGQTLCEIRGEISPHIRFMVRLPQKWTQRYLQTGCGGLCGTLDIRADHARGCAPYDDGSLVLASTDMGHQGSFMGDAAFGRDPQARIDFAYRGVHLTALASQALIQRYYGVPARYRYFAGCSDGGREGLMEAQRYPKDFDGIAAGAPAMNFQVQNSFYHAWQSRSNTGPDGQAILTARHLPLLHAAVLKACGAVDGVIEDPRACHFDPSALLCREAQDSGSCLSAAQVEAVRRLYAGPRDEAGRRFTPGGPQYGSELAWRGVFVPEAADQPIASTFMALGSVKNLIFEEAPPPAFGIQDFRFDQATFERLKPLHGLNDATDPDLGEFAAAGGKLILWHGWSDPHISPINTIAYRAAVRSHMGPERADRFMQLFMLPGLYHCRGGEGPVDFDVLTPLMRWVESQSAPDRLLVSQERRQSGPEGSGPPLAPGAPLPRAEPDNTADERFAVVFAYPALARYSGRGPRSDPASYEALPPRVQGQDEPPWEGAAFMRAGLRKTCEARDTRLACKPATEAAR